HLASTWLTWLGASISALWILVANAWMQYPVGMEFDPAQMRNVMDNFWALFSGIAVNKYMHAVFSGWALSGVFVIGVSAWFLYKGRNTPFAIRSIKVGGWLGLAGLLLTMWSGDGSAIEVTKHQPMKLAAMEGLYHGHYSQGIVAAGLLNPSKTWDNDEDEYLFDISVPCGLSMLAKHDLHAFVPGISDIVNGIDMNEAGDTINTVSYAERIRLGKLSHEALRAYDLARATNDQAAMAEAERQLRENYRFFGYGYFDSVDEAIPPVAMTFYSFRVMVILGSYFLLFFIVALFAAYKKDWLHRITWLQWVAICSVPLMWICSEAGWIVAEVGRQPWTVQDLLPTKAAISEISSGSVILTFWLFALIFTVLLVAEVSIMLRQISKRSKENLEIDTH
ncbi:MAG: cytochrome ubiquinol oxidase subunit I, partial [Muribaculaceae bacterium]|nr:cytochrome ubiquinol oxidase subunit I [Muribaculaceae bacterium]